MMRRQLLLLGLPGSGKGTQGARLAEYYEIPEIGSGEMIRSHIARGTEFGRNVEAKIASGNFVPDDDIIYWMGRRLHEPDAVPGYVLDGFPRDIRQAIAFDEQFEEHASKLLVIELHLPESVAINRLTGRESCPTCGRIYNEIEHPLLHPGQCGADGTALIRRPDDSPEAIRRRVEVYETLTAPVTSYYCRSGRLITINAAADEDTVFNRIVAAVDRSDALAHARI